MQVGDEQDCWLQICYGYLCSLCERPLPSVGLTFRYCAICAPTPALTPVRASLHIDHWDGWSVGIIVEGKRRWFCSLPALSDAQLERLILRVHLAPTARAQHPQSMASWGRSSLHIHMDRRQQKLFRWACRRQLCKPQPQQRRWH